MASRFSVAITHCSKLGGMLLGYPDSVAVLGDCPWPLLYRMSWCSTATLAFKSWVC